MGAGGRPKEPFIPWDGWEEDIFNLYSEGASDVEIRGLIMDKMGRDTYSVDLWNRWLREEEMFSSTIKKGRELCEVWWQKNGRVNLKDRDFNPTLWYMNMKNRFGWADKKEVDLKAHHKIEDLTDDELDGQIEKLTGEIEAGENGE